MRGPILSRRALFDIGVAGPLAGFVVAVIVLIVGLNLSTVVDRTATYGLHLGEPLLLQFMSWVVIGPLSPEADVVLHPIGFAAWFGLFVTSLNLLPIGQLDGGHVAYALWGRRQRTMALACLPILLILGILSAGRAGSSGRLWRGCGVWAILLSWILRFHWVVIERLSDGLRLPYFSSRLRQCRFPSTKRFVASSFSIRPVLLISLSDSIAILKWGHARRRHIHDSVSEMSGSTHRMRRRSVMRCGIIFAKYRPRCGESPSLIIHHLVGREIRVAADG